MENAAVQAVYTNRRDDVSAGTGAFDAKFKQLTDDFNRTDSTVQQLRQHLELEINFDESVVTDVLNQMKQV